MRIDRSRELFDASKKVIPGGVDSPVRAFRAVGGQPVFINRGSGSHIYDVDGNEYIDYVSSWGPLIAGHAHPRVVKALQAAAERGTSYGAPTDLELQLAEMVVEALPSVEMVRFVNSGTEAVMSALRLARAHTKRDKVLKFEGCYHGHADGVLVKAGSGVLTLGAPDSPGVPASAAQNTLTAPYNDLEIVREIFQKNQGEIAAVILEPVAGNIGVVLPKDGYLTGLRKICDENGALLIFDEVITGFRVAYGGAQSLYGVTPDLTTLGKIIGGGLPVGAFGGRREIMEMMAPSGPVYQAGTLSGNPLAMTAGIETLKVLQEPGAYDKLDRTSQKLADGLATAAREAGVPIYQTRIASMQCTFFTGTPVVDYATAKTSDTGKHARFFQAMLRNGAYFAPSQFEATFVSLAHTPEEIEKTVEAAREAFKEARDL